MMPRLSCACSSCVRSSFAISSGNIFGHGSCGVCAEKSKGPVADIRAGVGRRSGRIERAGAAGLEELKKIIIDRTVDAIHVHLQLIAFMEIAGVVEQRVVDISSVR